MLLGVVYWLGWGEYAAVETPAATDVEPTEGFDVQVPMASDAEEGTLASQERTTGGSTRAGVEKSELNELQKEKEWTNYE